MRVFLLQRANNHILMVPPSSRTKETAWQQNGNIVGGSIPFPQTRNNVDIQSSALSQIDTIQSIRLKLPSLKFLAGDGFWGVRSVNTGGIHGETEQTEQINPI